MSSAVEPSERPASLAEPTLLFTDIEGSTRLLEQLGDAAYAEVLAQHHAVIRGAISAHGGTEQGTEGDSFFATFDRAVDGVRAAATAQRGLAAADWTGGVQVRVRMGLHAGPIALVSGTLVGMSIHAAARIEAAAHGGQIVVSEAVAVQLEPGDEVTVRPLGSHQLRGISGRVELYQVDLAGLTRDFPPLASDPSDLVAIPRFLASFVGRERERSAVAQLLAENRIVTITGPPGVGKTRLAAAVLDGRGDAAFVDLASVDDAGEVADRVTTALGLRQVGDEDPLDAVARHLGTASLTVLIDNCEHLVDEVARVVTAVVLRTDAVRLLCTSREPLAIEGELVWPLQPLREAEDLFIRRARAADASTQLTSDDPRVVQICERLDRLPLAIELAAAQVGRLPVDELVVRLDELTGRLRSGRRDTPSRHRTLRAAIDWSVRLLDAAELAAFRRLAVMGGPFDLAVAEAVTDEPAEVIGALHERSLLELGDDAGGGRFRMLRTVRDAALEHLEAAGEAEEAARAHATAFQERAAARLHGAPTHMTTLAAIDDDADNYVQAVQWLTSHDPDGALALAADLDMLWTARLSPAVAGRMVERILAAAPAAPAPVRASVLLALADIDRSRGRVGEARRSAEAAFELAGDAETHDRYAAAVVLGQIAALQGELDVAERLFEDELRTARQLGDDQRIVAALREIANIAIERNRPDDAIVALDAATEAALGDEASRWMLGILASDRGRAFLALGRLDDARAEYAAALLPGQELGIGRAVAGCSLGMAQVERVAGNPGQAWPLVREAHRFYRDQGDTGGLAHSYVEAAMLRAAAGAHDAAVRLLAAAEAVRTGMGIATPGSELPRITRTWEAATAELGAAAVKRLDRAGRASTDAELAALI